MTRLNRKEVKFVWDDSCEQAFQELKRRLTSAPILMSRKGDRGTQCFVILRRTDWGVF